MKRVAVILAGTVPLAAGVFADGSRSPLAWAQLIAEREYRMDIMR